MSNTSHAILLGVFTLSSSVWVGGYVAIADVARVTTRTLTHDQRVAFFGSLGRTYGIIRGSGPGHRTRYRHRLTEPRRVGRHSRYIRGGGCGAGRCVNSRDSAGTADDPAAHPNADRPCGCTSGTPSAPGLLRAANWRAQPGSHRAWVAAGHLSPSIPIS